MVRVCPPLFGVQYPCDKLFAEDSAVFLALQGALLSKIC